MNNVLELKGKRFVQESKKGNGGGKRIAGEYVGVVCCESISGKYVGAVCCERIVEM